MCADDGVGAGSEGGLREGALPALLHGRALDAPVEGRDDDVGRPAGLAHALRDQLGGRGLRTRLVGPGVELGGEDVGEADEGDPQPEPRDHPRSRRRGEAAAGAHGLHAEPTHVVHGVEQRLRAVVAGVVVGEVEGVEAGVAGHRLQRGGPAAEVELLGHGRAACGDGALEVAEGHVGAAQHPRRTRPRVARPEDVDQRARTVAEVDVADGREQDRAGADGDRPRRPGRGDGAQPVARAQAVRAHLAAEAAAGVGTGGGERPPAAVEPRFDADPLVWSGARAAQRDRDARAPHRRGVQLERAGRSRQRERRHNRHG